MTATSRIRQTFSKLRRAVGPAAPAVSPDDVDWVYRTLLGRPPEDRKTAKDQAARHASVEILCHAIMGSPEFKGRWRRVKASEVAHPNRPDEHLTASDHDVIRSFAPYTGPGEPGFVTDFLGTKTRTNFVTGLDAKDGTVEGFPIPGNFHASANEWAGTLRSVAEAEAEFVGVELGAGWGPWLSACGAACRRRGIERFKLIGVEAAASHVEFMRQHFEDNNLDPEYHTLLHGASAAEDGFAEFPDLNDPALDYGATLFVQDKLLHRVIGPAVTRVKAYSIPTLLDEYRRVDLIHIDIQGSEADVVEASRETLKTKVRRLVIGTHGRAVEQRLIETLAGDGWLCETDHPCRYAPYNGSMALAIDGCQVWRNPEA